MKALWFLIVIIVGLWLRDVCSLIRLRKILNKIEG